ncbi:MAG: HAD family hydrolase [Rhodobacter sp.]|nr:HAD family hydrolase [Rhodobacter sp.]MCA3458264.1 HAD family hydrolase [Rhodobacter sp.]MCA3462112.1 HAD family hydrolase [Rhodobacter sp.]MCA3465739.1 HAD family hydrolase [Rhodobacter sp.]MCA3468803.1 HAD family hydrolase [Rhodobacter sp.]
MIDGIVFDKDGTLFDFRRSWGGWVQGVLAELATDPGHAAALADVLRFDRATGDFLADSPVIAASTAEIADILLPLLPEQSLTGLEARLNRLAGASQMVPAVPLRPLLQALRSRGLRLGVATNDVAASARAHLLAQDVAGFFDLVVGYDSGHGAKPGPGMLLAFTAQTGLDPARVLMVGDSRHDLMAGRAAGMRPVAVLTGIATEEDLAPLAEAVLPDIGALPGWIDARRAG